MGLDWQKNSFAHTSYFLYTSLLSLHDYDVKLPLFTFCGGREHKTAIFFFFFGTSIHSFRIQLQKNSPLLFCRIEQDGTNEIKFEAA